MVSEAQFELKSEERGSALVISVTGRVDGMNAFQFRDSLERGVQSHDGSAVVLDMRSLSYISSAGLRAVLLVAEALGRQSKKLAVCSLSKSTMEVIQATGFDSIIDVYVSRSSAVDAVTR